MDYFQDLTIAEKEIRKIADIKKFPIAGTFELTPLCNMDCRMCYVRMSKEEMGRIGRLRSAEEWITLGKQAVEQGLMFLLITGGEPFLHPEFLKIYDELRNMGLIIMINSNGTLLKDEILDGLTENKPRRVNLSLYGSSDEVYADLCRNPKGFTQVMNCVERLRERNIDIRFNMAITPWNKEDFPNMLKVADEYQIPVSIANYIFPAQRRNLTCEEAAKHRFSPELAGKYGVEISKLYESKEDLIRIAQNKLNKVKNATLPEREQRSGFWCRGGNSSFWVTWDWRMLPCGMVQMPAVQLQENRFAECWNKLRNEIDKIWLSSECYNCPKKSVCQSCAASMKTETGSYKKKPEYQCQMTEASLNAYKEILREYTDA